jgi:hypothetical protein
MGYDAERAEDDRWADPDGAEREAALDTGSGESWVDGGMVGHDAEEDLTDLGERPQDPAADARYLREIGYWNMTPAQRAGLANETLVEHTNSPKEGPEMYDMDDMGALEMQDAEARAQAIARREAVRQENLRREAARRYEAGDGDNPYPNPFLSAQERERAEAKEREFAQDLLDVFGNPFKPGPFPLAGTKDRLERKEALERKLRKAAVMLGQYEPVNPDRPEKSEAVRQAQLHNRIKGVLGGWGVSTDPAKEAPATVEELERLRDWSTARLAHLTRFPAEPELTDGPCVVSFSRTYGGRAYSYAALRVPAGRQRGTWVVTGPRSPAYVSWDELMIWVEKGTPSDQAVVIATVSSWILES